MRLANDVVAAHLGPTGVRCDQRGQHPNGGGLSGTVRTEQAENRTRPDREIHASESGGVSESLDQTLNLDGVRRTCEPIQLAHDPPKLSSVGALPTTVPEGYDNVAADPMPPHLDVVE